MSGNVYWDNIEHLPNFICSGKHNTNNSPQTLFVLAKIIQIIHHRDHL